MSAQSDENNFSIDYEMKSWEKYFHRNPDISIYYYIPRNYFFKIEKDINKRIFNFNEYFIILEQNNNNGVDNVYLIYPCNTYWQALTWSNGSEGKKKQETFEISVSAHYSSDFSFYTPYPGDLDVSDATSIYVKHVKNGTTYRHAFYGLDIGGDESRLQHILDLCCGNSDLLQ